ncbi:hypothetical protein CAEBREN_09214 [Caenorhabditis brenneri]|uniref:SPK domain-containing protein n=1 Tax=Caenorhabditis brenneri TaxID=135651 RepID=G0NS79_CAEBE|nr:hypothetical protein CAEBREN_09214 [Caenorhabditis brenneri]
MTSANTEAIILSFIQNEVSQNTEIRTASIFCNDFNSAHPDHAAPWKTIHGRVRKALRNIPHEKYDDTTLAKMMFCLAQPMSNLNLLIVKERLGNSGILRVDKSCVITYYKNDEVELKGAHQRKNKRERARDERTRRESQEHERERFANLEIKFDRQMEEEARELGEREKAKEEAERKAEEERVRMESLDEDWGFDDPNIPSTSDQSRPRSAGGQAEQEEETRAPVSEIPRVELTETPHRPIQEESTRAFSCLWIRGIDNPDGTLLNENRRVGVEADEEEEPEAPVAKRPRIEVSVSQSTPPELLRPQIHEADSTVFSIGFSPAPTIIRNQKVSLFYFAVMKGIYDFTVVFEDSALEPLRKEVFEELLKPESVSMHISENKISEALDEGIKIAVKSAKSDNIGQAMGLIEFMRFLKLQMLNIGFPRDNECVIRMTDIIRESSQKMVIPISKVRFAMETIFEKARQ